MDWTRAVSLVVAFSLFNAAAAQFSLNIGPIPITGQSFAVTLTGALLGSRLGATALVSHTWLKAVVGLPFFANWLWWTSVASSDHMVATWFHFQLPLTSPAPLLKTVGTVGS
jgi:hypothetical protein